jgi:hypothetical protein
MWKALFSGILDVRQKGKVASAFNGVSQLALMAGTRASLASWADFSILGYKPPKHIDLFVIDRNV